MSASTAEPPVWVVTPVYNGEEYLAECIESVLAQTYSTWEHVVVDNRSTDRTAEIVRGYAKQDDRIRLHTNERFLPMMKNWNHALRLMPMESRYCKVVHSDDVLFPQCLERMVAVAEAHPSVGVVSAFRLFGTRVYGDRVVPYGVSALPGRHVCRITLLDDEYLFGSPSTTLLRADVVRAQERFYDEENPHADADACFDVLRATDLGFVHQVLTYSRLHAEAETSRADRLHTYRRGWIMTTTKYGPTYLARDEYDRYLAWGRWGVLRYGAFLAKEAVRLRFLDPEWRDYQRGTVGVMRRSVGGRELVRGTARGLAARARGRRAVPSASACADSPPGRASTRLDSACL
jgi:glycosyltransferase involved in cell wall biosynthesis